MENYYELHRYHKTDEWSLYLSTFKITSLEIIKYHIGWTFRAHGFKTQLAELLEIHVQKYIWNYVLLRYLKE